MQRISCSLRYRLVRRTGKGRFVPLAAAHDIRQGQMRIRCLSPTQLFTRTPTNAKIAAKGAYAGKPPQDGAKQLPRCATHMQKSAQGRAPKQDMPRLAPCIRKNIPPPNAGGLFFVARVTQKELPPTPRLGKRKHPSERCGNERPVSNEKAAQCR